MKIPQSNRLQSAGFVELIIAMMVLIIGAIIIYQIARLLSQVFPAGSSTNNSTSFYYQTNYSYSPLMSQDNYQATSSTASQPPTFTFSYGIRSSNGIAWTSISNVLAIAGGCDTELENDSNFYAISVNMGTYSVYLKYDAQTGNQISESSNAAIAAVILKSTNLVHWNPIYTNLNCLPDIGNEFTDRNAVEPAAFYRVVTN